MEKTKFNRPFILGITLVSAMGGLLFGYDWVVIGGAKPFYERFFEIASSPSLQGWAMSSALIGCLAGAMASGYLSDHFGRKRPLIAAAALFTIAAFNLHEGNAEEMNTSGYAAISSARLALSCPFISARSIAGGGTGVQ